MRHQDEWLVKASSLGFRFESTDGLQLCVVPTFQLQPGQLLVIVGPNGCGKSTLCKAICGLHTPQYGKLHRNMDGDPLLVWQSKELFPTTVEGNLSLVGASDRDITEALYKFDLMRYRGKHVASLSGGQQQRLSLARALFVGRKRSVVVFDEPTQDLDPDAVSEVLSVIRELRESCDKAIVVVTHSVQLLSALGAMLDCQVATFDNVLPNCVSDGCQFSDVCALHAAVSFAAFAQTPPSPFGAYMMGIENVFGAPSTVTGPTLHDLYPLKGMTENHDLVFVPATAFTIVANEPSCTVFLKIQAAGLAERREGETWRRRYKTSVGNRLLQLLVANGDKDKDTLIDSGYAFIAGDHVLERSSARRELCSQAKAMLAGLELGL